MWTSILPRREVAGDDAAGLAVDHDEVQHVRARVHFHRAEADLAFEGLVGAEKELLAGLAAGVEGARDLSAAEGAVIEEAAVLAGEGHALGDALVDDVHADLGEAVDVGFARAEVAALDGVVEEAVDAVAVVLIIFGGVDAALRGDGVGAARAVLEAEALDVVAELGQAGGGGAAGEAGTHHDDGVLALVGGIDQLEIEAVAVPGRFDRASGGFRIEFHAGVPLVISQPARAATGMEMLPMAMSRAQTAANRFSQGV